MGLSEDVVDCKEGLSVLDACCVLGSEWLQEYGLDGWGVQLELRLANGIYTVGHQ